MTQPLKIETPRVFVPLLAPARYKGAHGGRGSGKSHQFAEMLVERAYCQPGLRWVCVREVQKDLKESAKLLLEDKLEKFRFPGFRPMVDRIETPGSGLIIFRGMQDYTSESIKSLEGFDGVWIEEAQTISDRSLEMLRPTIRKPGSEIWASWNPRNATDPIDELLRGPSPPPGSIVVRANYNDNPFFPPELEREREYDRVHRAQRYAHIWLGEYEPMAIGAIWDRANFNTYRRQDVPPMSRIVVGIDPAISAEKGSDEHGIIVAGAGEDDRGYVLADGTLRGTPRQWAERAIALYDRWDADAIVIERNQGGDMCRHTLESVRKNIRIIDVVATRGKHVRAEPISALYALGRVSHVGTFPELENQMCLMTAGGYEGDGSPDRCDALVWSFSELFPAMTTEASKQRETTPAFSGAGSWMG